MYVGRLPPVVDGAPVVIAESPEINDFLADDDQIADWDDMMMGNSGFEDDQSGDGDAMMQDGNSDSASQDGDRFADTLLDPVSGDDTPLINLVAKTPPEVENCM